MSSALERIARNVNVKKSKNKEVQASKGVAEDLLVILVRGDLRLAQLSGRIPRCK